MCRHLFSVLLGVYLGAELQGHTVTVYKIIFEELSDCSLKHLYYFTFSAVYPLSTSSATHIIICLLQLSHFTGCEVIMHVILIVFPWWLMMLSILSGACCCCLVAIVFSYLVTVHGAMCLLVFIYFLWRKIYSYVCPFKN